jgi:hypothetical protein
MLGIRDWGDNDTNLASSRCDASKRAQEEECLGLVGVGYEIKTDL